jgi:hypothetical protein
MIGIGIPISHRSRGRINLVSFDANLNCPGADKFPKVFHNLPSGPFRPP